MKVVRYAALNLLALTLTYLLTSWWINTKWSEITYTWLNHLFQQNLGLASDIELILTIACFFVISLFISSLLFCVFEYVIKWARRSSKTYGQRD